MFNMFPFNFTQIFSGSNFTSFTSFTGFMGQNGFNINDQFNNFTNEFENIMSDFLSGVDFDKLYSEYNNALKEINEELTEKEECDFINFEEFQDMYLLKIDLTGIDLRELSIKYNPGTIKVSLKRAELEKMSGYLGYGDQRIVKKSYIKIFENIEDIDISKVYKNIDNGIYTLNMPKKYMIDGQSKIIEIDNYSVQSEPEKTELIENKKEE